MKLEDQKLALAKAHGWKLITKKFKRTDGMRTGYNWDHPEYGFALKGGGVYGWGFADTPTTFHLPDYINNFGWLHDARQKLIKTTKSKNLYIEYLKNVVGRRDKKNQHREVIVSDYDILNAEPHEHLEALVRTIGAWKD